ncbi:unnamed protein product [Rotaria sordida]|uniref:Uncharacterized protein n=1 Tax=Rotaria sordida TaxID=392033 RepID=A0A815D1D2_9BILA|nr:unnamed protein product [Rotaria sordida]CAF1567563.1 unnamed protein product [Rotaria sordida]
MFFSVCLWRLLRRQHSSSQTDGSTKKIRCGTCLNLTLTTMSYQKNNSATLLQSSDLTTLSILQVSKHTSTLENMIAHPADTTPTITITTTATSEITTIINTMSSK